MTSLLKVAFWNVEGLRSKLENKDFLDFVSDHYIIGVAESWTGPEVFENHRFISYSKGRLRAARYGRNPRGLAIFGGKELVDWL
jgi:hypothetical protein